MKITSVTTSIYTYNVPDLEWPGNSYRWNSVRNLVLVRVETDNGLVGYGEADAAGGPAIITSEVVEKEIGPQVIGMDPICTEEIYAKLYLGTMVHGRRGVVLNAISGVDIALWDIKGKYYNEPIYRLLGGARDRVLGYHSGGFYHKGVPDEWYADEARNGKAQGYRAFKMKIGRLTQEHDANRVRLVREAIGPDAKLMVDMNSKYTVREAIRMARLIEPYDIYFFEEPVSVDDHEGSAEVGRHIDLPIAGYETEYSRYGFADLIDRHAVDFVQVDVNRSGGFTECQKIAAYAAAHRLPITTHIFSSGMAVIASLHFVCGVETGCLLECEANKNPLRTEIFKDFHIKPDEDGNILVPNRPGLGVTIDFDAIEPYRVR